MGMVKSKHINVHFASNKILNIQHCNFYKEKWSRKHKYPYIFSKFYSFKSDHFQAVTLLLVEATNTELLVEGALMLMGLTADAAALWSGCFGWPGWLGVAG